MGKLDNVKYLNGSSSQQIKSEAGAIYGIIVNSHTSGTIELNDGTTATEAGVKATQTLTSSGASAPAVYAESVFTSAGASVPAVYAESTVTASTIVDTDTITIDATVYTFKTTPASAYDVNLGANDAAALDNLKLAINASGVGDGTDYFAGTAAHPTVIATTNTDTTQKVVARIIGSASNAEATTSTGGTLTWADTTLGGGTGTSVAGVATTAATATIGSDVYTAVTSLAETHGLTAIPYQVLWVTSEAVFLDNLKSAINNGGTEGTDYATGTPVNANVIATTNTNTTQAVVARVIGTAANTLATTTTLANYSWEDTTLGGGTGSSVAGVDTTLATTTIDGEVYTAVTSLAETHGLTAIPYQVLWVTSEAVFLDNLKSAINNTATEGTDYGTGTPAHSSVSATTNTDTTQIVQALAVGTAGNLLATTTTLGNYAWGAATLTGGHEPSVLIMNTYTLTSGSQVLNFPQGISFYNGLYLNIGATTVDYTVLYN